MALIKCSECGKEISDKATNCPNCGYPIEKETRKVVIKRNNFAAALKAYITVDNVDIGSIRVNKDITIDLPLGKHTINVNTVGLKGESTAVDGTQIEITSDMEVINILVGGKYSLTTEIAGMSQEIKLLEVDYGNGKKYTPYKKEKKEKEETKETKKEVKEKKETEAKFNYKILLIILAIVLFIIIVIVLLSTNKNDYYGTYTAEYREMGKVVLEIDKNGSCTFKNNNREVDCTYTLDKKDERLEISIPLPVNDETIKCGRFTKTEKSIFWSCTSKINNYISLNKSI